MSIHRFAIETGHRPNANTDEAWPSFRSDVEQRHTLIALHDEESADILQARRLADEMINVCGAEVMVYARTDNADFDRVWDEDADPTYWDKYPIKAFFKPQPLQTELAKWGADTINKTEVVFSHRQVYQEFKDRMLRAGDVIQLPYNAIEGPKNYRIVNAAPTGNFRYIWLYLTCQVETLTADVTVRVADDMPNVEAPTAVGVYRESL